MELQWPLILFTTLVAWCAGLFGAQAVAAFKGEAKKSQMTSWICSAVLLVLGGIAVFMHLEHWERIFNGFGHITSGITQELIAIVLLAIIAIIYLIYLRKNGDGTVPKWCAIVAVILSAALVIVMAHSYVMAARPAWDSFLQIGSLLGAALIAGPLTLAVIMAVRGDDLKPLATWGLVAVIVGAVLIAAYACAMAASGGSFTNVGYYFDPVHPTSGMEDASAAIAAQAPLIWAGGVVVGAVIPVICAALAWKKSELWKACGAVGAICAVAGAICLRVAFYGAGLSVFMFY